MEQLRDFTELDFVGALDRLPTVRDDELERLTLVRLFEGGLALGLLGEAG